jgi:hypothetical protein
MNNICSISMGCGKRLAALQSNDRKIGCNVKMRSNGICTIFFHPINKPTLFHQVTISGNWKLEVYKIAINYMTSIQIMLLCDHIEILNKCGYMRDKYMLTDCNLIKTKL